MKLLSLFRSNLRAMLAPGKYGSLVYTIKGWLINSINRTGIEPEIWIADIKSTYPHKETSITQGMEFNNGTLYESTGMKGQSRVAQVDLSSGNYLREICLDSKYFGEGITVLGDWIYYLTWHEQECFVYGKDTLKCVKSLAYEGEGWGLCNDASTIIMSNGTEEIVFRDPGSFKILRKIKVRDNKGLVFNLNELEYIDGLIYANIWMTNRVVVIQPENGIVIAEIDGTEIERNGRLDGEAMNGIAHDPTSGKTYFTGKKWPRMVETVVKKQSF
jgi:glutamine cyclotransferase